MEGDGRRADLQGDARLWQPLRRDRLRGRFRPPAPAGGDAGERAGWAGDASFRKYFPAEPAARLGPWSWDAPPPQEDVRPFVAPSAVHLIGPRSQRARRSMPRDEANGFLLLEDLGDDTFARVLAAGRRRRRALWPRHRRAGRLASCRQTRALLPGLGAYAGETLIDAAMVAAGLVICPPPPADRHRTRRHWPIRARLARLPRQPAGRAPTRLLLRDYHKDNLMWFAGSGPGVMACGLLDFQDAQQGPPLLRSRLADRGCPP